MSFLNKTSIVILLIGLMATYFVESYQYHECKNVGHTTTYCVFKLIW